MTFGRQVWYSSIHRRENFSAEYLTLEPRNFNTMTASITQQRAGNQWEQFCEWVTSTDNRLYVGWFGTLMSPCLLAATICFIVAFVAAPPVDINLISVPHQ